MIVRNVFNIKELKKLKAEKAARVEEINRFLNEGPFNATYKFVDIKDRYYPNPQKADE